MSDPHPSGNQPPPLVDYDLFSGDPVLPSGVAREGAGSAAGLLAEVGRLAGSPEVQQWGFDANRFPPELRTHDRFGNRIDEVSYHPAYHRLMTMSVEHGLHSLPWEGGEGGHVARAAMFSMVSQIESGHGCPISMSYSVVPALRHQPEVADEWIPRLLTRTYDPAMAPAPSKSGVLMGMAMTERQGGSDVRANVTGATPLDGGGPGTAYALQGSKWFCSAPMCDAFLVLARTPAGISCFLLPRWTPDGMRNRFHIQRLKDKLGNRSNASSEVEFDGAWAVMVGEEGRGIRTIIEMVQHTRLDCVIGSTGVIRQAVAQATHHAAHRSAFGRLLIDQPLMRNVLADLAVESEAATHLMLRLAGAFDRREDEHEAALSRIAIPLGKYWVTKRTSTAVGEALECLGGNGYVEESIMPRLFRESPLNSIWEGSGNVIALDVLRAMAKEPHSLDAFMVEIEQARGGDTRLDGAIDVLAARLARPEDPEWSARSVVESMALALQGALLVRFGHPAVADAFCATRLAGDRGHTFGTLPGGLAVEPILDRAGPHP